MCRLRVVYWNIFLTVRIDKKVNLCIKIFLITKVSYIFHLLSFHVKYVRIAKHELFRFSLLSYLNILLEIFFLQEAQFLRIIIWKSHDILHFLSPDAHLFEMYIWLHYIFFSLFHELKKKIIIDFLDYVIFCLISIL